MDVWKLCPSLGLGRRPQGGHFSFAGFPFAGGAGKPSGLSGPAPTGGFRFRPEGRVSFCSCRKKPKTRLGGVPPVRPRPQGRASLTVGPPPKNPRFTGEQNRCVPLTTGVRLLTLPATHGGPRPFADLICFSRPPPMGAWSWCSSLRPLRLTPHPPRCARHLLLKEKAFGMAGYSAFPLRGRWHSEAVTDEVRRTQGPRPARRPGGVG